MRLKKRDSHLTCKVAKKCLNVREWVGVTDRNKDGPPSSPAAPWIISLCERKPWQKKSNASLGTLVLWNRWSGSAYFLKLWKWRKTVWMAFVLSSKFIMSVFGIFPYYDFILDFFVTNTVTFSNTFLLLSLELLEIDDSGLSLDWLLNRSLD